MKEKVCKKCGHKWVPRTDNPKSCPGCKSYNWDEDVKGESDGTHNNIIRKS